MNKQTVVPIQWKDAHGTLTLLIVAVVSPVCTCLKTYQIVHLKYVYIIWQLYLTKVVFKIKDAFTISGPRGQGSGAGHKYSLEWWTGYLDGMVGGYSYTDTC